MLAVTIIVLNDKVWSWIVAGPDCFAVDGFQIANGAVIRKPYQ